MWNIFPLPESNKDEGDGDLSLLFLLFLYSIKVVSFLFLLFSINYSKVSFDTLFLTLDPSCLYSTKSRELILTSCGYLISNESSLLPVLSIDRYILS